MPSSDGAGVLTTPGVAQPVATTATSHSHRCQAGGRTLTETSVPEAPGSLQTPILTIYEYINILNSVPPAHPSVDLQAFKAEFFKALAHPLRIRLLEILRHRERSVQELQAALGLDQSTVSQHLAVLRAKHVVVARKEGTTVRYACRDALVGDLLDVARRIFNNQLAGHQTMLRALQRETRRPVRR